MIRWRTFLCKILGIYTSILGALFHLLPTDASKTRCNSLSPVTPKQNCSTAISNLEAVYHIFRFLAQLLYDMTFLPSFNYTTHLSPNFNFYGWLQNVRMLSKGHIQKDSTSMPTNFNLELLDDNVSRLLSATTSKVSGVGAEHQKYR